MDASCWCHVHHYRLAAYIKERMVNGKGDSPRPVNRDKFESNYDEIKWNDRGSVDCKGCQIGCRYFQKTGVVCFPVSKQQESQQIHIRTEREQEDQGEG